MRYKLIGVDGYGLGARTCGHGWLLTATLGKEVEDDGATGIVVDKAKDLCLRQVAQFITRQLGEVGPEPCPLPALVLSKPLLHLVGSPYSRVLWQGHHVGSVRGILLSVKSRTVYVHQR